MAKRRTTTNALIRQEINPDLIGPPKPGIPDVHQQFLFIVRKLVNTGRGDEYLTFNQVAALAYKSGDYAYVVRSVTGAYSDYVIYSGQKLKFDISRLRYEHPEIWTGKKANPSILDFDSLKQSLWHELKAASGSSSKRYIELVNITRTSVEGEIATYRGRMVIESDEVDILPEGIKVRLKGEGWKTHVTILEQDHKNELVIFQTNKNLTLPTKAKLEASPATLLKALHDQIEFIEQDPISLARVERWFFDRFSPNTVEYTGVPIFRDLDDSQRIAVELGLENDITYIWGPPGTGKSHTLATLLLNLYKEGSRTVVCSTANVAVDELLKKFIKACDEELDQSGIDLLKNRKVLRLGFVHNEDLRKEERIYPETEDIRNARSAVERLEDWRRCHSPKDPDYDMMLSQLQVVKRDLSKKQELLIENAQIVFCTCSKAYLHEVLKKSEFDNLVIDEGSMVSAATLVALSSYARKRLIVAGDFRQLGPIAVSSSSAAMHWLKRSAFDVLGKTDSIPDHRAVVQLTYQRRCHPQIAELINEKFYNGKLKTIIGEKHRIIENPKGVADYPHIFFDLSDAQLFEAERTARHSRINRMSNACGENMLLNLMKHDSLQSIGLITPYRGQVNSYRQFLEQIAGQPGSEKVRIGTIHSFQGSECDVIVLDMVDSKDLPIGNLYHGIDGERLINVAVSRAIRKLIVIGDYKVLSEGDRRDQVSSKVRRLIHDIPRIREIEANASN